MADITVDVYTTQQGDTWDQIAYQVYGDERYMSVLLAANPDLVSVVILPAGVEIIAPDIEVAIPESLPPWKRGDSL